MVKKKSGTSKKKKVSKATGKKTAKKKAKKKAKKTGSPAARRTPVKKAVKKARTAARAKGKKGGGGKPRRSGALTAGEIEAFRNQLLQRRGLILNNLSKMESGALRACEQDPSVDNMADYGTDNFEQDFTLGLMENVESVLKEIDAAIARIDGGDFGVCEGCSCTIPKARLKAIPYARFCVSCQSEMEKLV